MPKLYAAQDTKHPLGLHLLALRSAIKSNYAFGRAVRRQIDIDGQHARES
jgi:hypothetical protein